MSTATLTSKGQVTIPVQVRSALGVATGDRIEFIETDDGRFEVIAATESIKSLKGCIPKPSKPVTIEEMNDAIAEQGAKAK